MGPGYSDYFKKLIRTPNYRNPWFGEYLRRYYNCTNDPNEVSNYKRCNITKVSVKKFKVILKTLTKTA